MPNTINNYERVLVPVITADGKYLYFDRKNHPENTGSINDHDDIWRSRRILPEDYIQYDTLAVPLQESDMNLLLQDKSINDIEKYFKSKINSGTTQSNLSVVDSLSLLEPENLGKPLNTTGSDVIFTITPDGNNALVYGIYNSVTGLKEPGFSISKMRDGKWSFPEPIEIRNYYNNPTQKNGFSTMFFYGSLSPDCQTLILALNRNDGFGDLDIYVSFLIEGNRWSAPKNLGSLINTPFTEAAPFLALDGKTLYYASDGKGGSGMLDLFIVRRLDDSWEKWSEPVNLGKSINGSYDEKGIYLTALGDEAYIISKDTIEKRYGVYNVELPDSLMPGPYSICKGSFFAANNNHLKYYSGKVKVSLFNEAEALPYYITGNEGRQYIISVRNDRKTRIRFEADGLNPVEFISEKNTTEKPVILKKDILFTAGYKAEIKNLSIFFDYDSDQITDSAAKALMDFLKEKPEIIGVRVTGHADEQGPGSYNMDLSMRRAKNIQNLFISNGVSANIIQTDWKGSSKPVSKDLSKNRRVEIVIETRE